jgi:hypothetical protein
MKIRSSVLWMVVLCVTFSASLFLAACGGKTPAGPTTNGTPTPVAVNTATPAPTPVGTPLAGVSCNLPPSGPPAFCTAKEDGDGVFRADVDAAISDLQGQEPHIFDGLGIKDLGAYRVGVTRNLEARGYCAMWDGDDIGIKKGNNEISEHYHVDVSNGSLQRGKGAYLLRCHPAAFPINPGPLPARGDCSIPSSAAYGCSHLDETYAQFVSVMDEVEAEVAQGHPDISDGRMVTEGKHNDYYAQILVGLRARGFCAFQDGDMINLKAISENNAYSEWYHPILSNGQVWNGYKAYRGTCRPAVF